MIALLKGWLGWALGIIAVALVGLAGLIVSRDDVADVPEQSEEPAVIAEPAPDQPQVATQSPTPETPDAAPTPQAPMAPPAFDVVRVSPEGSAIVAGHAAPGAQITVLVEGLDMAQASADGGGNFVALFDLELSDKPRLMQLAAQLGTSPRVLSESTFIIEPMDVPLEMVAVPDTPVETPDAVVSEEPVAAPTPEPVSPRVLRADRDGIVVVDDGQTSQGIPLSLDTIAYDDDGAVTVAGRGQPEAGLRLYLDNQLQGEGVITETGRWSLVLPDVEPGIYTLRADEIGPDGGVTARVESPFKREEPEQLAMAAGVVGTAPQLGNGEGPVDDTQIGVEPVAAPEPAQEVTELDEPATAPIHAETEAPDVVVPDEDTELQPVEPEAARPGDANTPDIAAPEAAPAPDVAPEAPPLVAITVQPGSTLWAIARERYGEGTLYVEVFDANREKIRNPDLIYPGQVFALPQSITPR